MYAVLVRSEEVQQGCSVDGNNEIDEKKEYIYFGRMVNMCRYMDAKILQRIRSGWKVFTTIKDELKAKLDKTQCANLFNNAVL